MGLAYSAVSIKHELHESLSITTKMDNNDFQELFQELFRLVNLIEVSAWLHAFSINNCDYTERKLENVPQKNEEEEHKYQIPKGWGYVEDRLTDYSTNQPNYYF